MSELIELNTCKICPNYSKYLQEYVIDNPDSMPRGVVRAQVQYLIMPFGSFYDFFIKNGLKEHDEIGFISNFWPNGLPIKDMVKSPQLEPFMRQGRGSKVLDFVLDDLIKKFDVKMAYFDGNNVNPIYLRNFLLKKHRFSEIILNKKQVIDEQQNPLYKMLQLTGRN